MITPVCNGCLKILNSGEPDGSIEIKMPMFRDLFEQGKEFEPVHKHQEFIHLCEDCGTKFFDLCVY